ncbi:MAG: flagellar filament capping protein FliD [Planctomycetota bacterium]
MSAIQSSVGLITGIPIQDTVDQLIAISARPRDQLVTRTNEIQSERGAVDTLSSLVLSLQFSANRFDASSTFTGRTASSSSTGVGVAIPNGSTPQAGSYQFTPLQSASASQYVSGSVDDISEAIGSGTLRFGFGGQVDSALRLEELNGGAGVAAGQIKITDRSGASATVDLRSAQTVDDVLLAINATTDISVSASTSGDTFVLTDDSGGSGSLSVTDIGLGTTAADLGLDGKSTTTATLTGDDVYNLTSTTKLTTLNDGNGVRLISGQDDLRFTARDGSGTFGVDLGDATTLGDVVTAINTDSDNNGKVVAAINSSGTGLTITDATGATTNNFVVANGLLGSAATDLGIAADIAGATVNGSRIASVLKDTLVGSLGGGAGVTLGEITLTDRAGTSFDSNLAGLETLGQIVDQINADATTAGANARARVNDSRNGIVVEDTVGGGTSLAVVDKDSNATATALGIAGSTTGSSLDSGSLNRQTVSESTLLSSLNGGQGVSITDFFITDSAGVQKLVDLNASGAVAETIGDVIDKINALGNGVLASINTTGDGILLTDTAGGSGTLTVAESGTGAAAADLGLLGASTATDGSNRQIIDGSTRYSVDLSDLTQSSTSISLSTLNSGSGVNLGIFQITDSLGRTAAVALNKAGSEAFTIGDVINAINAESAVSVTAAVNSAGTGIELTDTAGGSGTLTIEDLGSGTSAADLGLAGTSSTTDGSGNQTINASGLFAATDADQGALQTLATRINDLNAGVTAAVLSDAGGFRLSITADSTGSDNELLIDAAATGLSFQQTSRAADAVALFGSSIAGGGFAVTSENNRFNGIIDGLDITVNEANGATATIDIATDDSPFTTAVQDFVDSYNSVRTNLDAVTSFDSETLSTGILFGRAEAVRVDTDLARLVSGQILSGVKFGSLESVGVSLGSDGKLSVDGTKLRAAYAEDPSGVEALFTDDTEGFVTKLTDTIDSLAGDDNSLLSSRSDALNRTIEVNDARIADMTASLEVERNRLLLEFIQLEETIALLQTNLDALGGIQDFSFASSSSSSGS